METEQAHSSRATAVLEGRDRREKGALGRDAAGRDAALRRPGTDPEASDALPPLPHPRTAQRAVPTVTWLNLVCLDAPIVAVTWLCLFARVFRVPVSMGNATALFLTAWLIYLADRVVDASSLKSGTPRSLRQEFCLRHREIWVSALVIIGAGDAFVIWRDTAAVTFLAGAVVGVLALLYLVLNQPLGLIWRSLPAKEIAIGLLFAAGTLVALLPTFPPFTFSFLAGAVFFAALCALNCIAIARWEHELDRAQRKVSLATRYPSVTRHVGKFCVCLALAALGLAISLRSAAALFVCLGVSALLLTALNSSFKEGRFANRRSLGPDARTALADLVLLTPLAVLLMAGL